MADPCKDLSSAVRVGQGTLMLLRSSRDVLPFRCGPSLTTYMVDYIPPILMPGYTGGYPAISTCFSTTGGAVTRRNLQSERIDILGSRVRRKFLYGRLPCDFSPYPDVASARKVMKWKKLAEPSVIIPTNVDECKRDELRYFHERCMDFRDYYLDKTNTLHTDPFFDVGRPYPVRCPVDERAFKIRRAEDICDRPDQFLGPQLRCGGMPCLKQTGMLNGFVIPKLPRSPFQCDAIKPKDPNEHTVLLV